MDRIDDLLRYIRKTNPEMTKERLIEELGKCHYSTVGLIMTWQNSKKQAKKPEEKKTIDNYLFIY